MLVINDKIVLHMPRCGGSSLRWGLYNSGVTYRYSCEHAPLWSLPHKYKGFESVGVVRHPSSWYRSIFYYQRMLGKKSSSVLGYILSDGFKSDFSTFYNNSLSLEAYFEDFNNLMRLKKRIRFIQMNKYTCWHVLNWPDVENPLQGIAGKTLYEHWYNTVGLDKANNIFVLEDGFDWVSDFFGQKVNITHRNGGNAPFFEVDITKSDLHLYNRRP